MVVMKWMVATFLQDCFNEVGNYHCECKEGTEKGEDGVCQEFKHIECGIKAKKSKVKGFKGTNVKVKVIQRFKIIKDEDKGNR